MGNCFTHLWWISIVRMKIAHPVLSARSIRKMIIFWKWKCAERIQYGLIKKVTVSGVPDTK